MASNRRNRPEGKSLRLTDFFASTEGLDEAHLQDNTLGTSSLPPTPQSQSPSLQLQPSQNSTMEHKKSAQASSNKQTSLKRGALAHANIQEMSTPPVIGAASTSPLLNLSTSNSPVKSRSRLDGDTAAPCCLSEETTLTTSPSEDILDTFPTSNQAVSESFLKEMMLALRSSIQHSFTSVLNQQMTVIDELGNRVHHVEQKMGDFSGAHNDLVDAHNALEDEVAALSAKVADIEDRNRRNNVKIRGVPELVSPSDLSSYVQQLIKAVLPSTTTHDLIIDRAHRLPKPKSLPDSTPRDVIVRIHFFHIKDDFMQTARKLPQLPDPYHRVKLFADLSQFTIRARQRLAPITATLRQHNVLYRWGYPTKLIITRNGVTHTINTLDDGSKVLQTLGIAFSLALQPMIRPTGIKVGRDWTLTKDAT